VRLLHNSVELRQLVEEQIAYYTFPPYLGISPRQEPGMQGLSTRPPLFWNYTRYSTPPQQWGDSDRRQLVEGRHRADALQMTFVDSYRDLGISAYQSRNRTNGALGQFLADLRSPPRVDPWPMPGDVLHCENFDRLSRADPEDSLKLFMDPSCRLARHRYRAGHPIGM
jgi:hypothetical protein